MTAESPERRDAMILGSDDHVHGAPLPHDKGSAMGLRLNVKDSVSLPSAQLRHLQPDTPYRAARRARRGDCRAATYSCPAFGHVLADLVAAAQALSSLKTSRRHLEQYDSMQSLSARRPASPRAQAIGWYTSA